LVTPLAALIAAGLAGFFFITYVLMKNWMKSRRYELSNPQPNRAASSEPAQSAVLGRKETLA
jgi:hypothetical protein